MSKMREAFEKWSNDALNIPDNEEVFVHRESFEAGYQAAIAAVKEGGPVSFCGTCGDYHGDLYKLPEDV